MEIETKYNLGDKVFFVDIPTEETCMCENLASDNNFDKNENCKKDCYRDCCLLQATVKETIVDSIDVVVDDVDFDTKGAKIILNGYIDEKSSFKSETAARKELEKIIKCAMRNA